MLPGQLKVTGGLGWGRFGSHGSIATLGTRGAFVGGDTGGELSTDQWFRGDIAPFGGVEWTHGKWGLKAEYSSDAYTLETGQAQAFERRSSVNFGVEYQASRQLRLGGLLPLWGYLWDHRPAAAEPAPPANALAGRSPLSGGAAQRLGQG